MEAILYKFLMINAFYYILFVKNVIKTFIPVMSFILCLHILPYRQADLTASASLQGIRGGGPQLHTLRLASAATSACEFPRIIHSTQKAKSSMSLQPYLNFMRLCAFNV